MKRLLCIVGGMNAGGAETFLMKVYRALDKTKYQMDFAVAIKDKGFYDDEIISMGGKIFHITPKSCGFFKNFFDIYRIVKNNGYQSVLRTSQHSLSALELLAARFGGAKKLVFRSSNSNTSTGNVVDFLLHKLCMFMPLFFANIRIAPSTEAAVFMFGKNAVKKGIVKIIPNGIDFSYYKYDEGFRGIIRKEFGLENCFVVGHTGRFNTQKNHLFLLDVFFRFHKDNPNSKLLLVGDGFLKEQIVSKIKDYELEGSVILAGIRSDIPALYSAMDVFVFPSLYEGMPNTVIEAQACGLKCIISDCITKEADITSNVSYLPIKENDIQIWVDEIVKSMKKMINVCRLPSEYDIKNVVIKFQELIYGENV